MERIKVRKRKRDIEIERNIIERFLMNLKGYVKNNRQRVIYFFVGFLFLCILSIVLLIYIDTSSQEAHVKFEIILDNYRRNINDKKVVKKTIDDLVKLRKSTYFGFARRMSDYVIGNIYFSNKNYKKAEMYLIKYADSNSQSVFTGMALQKAAISAEERNELDVSLEIYKRLLKDYSNSIIADQIYYNMSRLYLKKKDFVSSKRYLDTLISSYPQSNLAKSAKTKLMLMGINKK
ncbi:tol-pal system YbgF family protein [Spirochaetota bacterium]